jgi:hypothetical protein
MATIQITIKTGDIIIAESGLPFIDHFGVVVVEPNGIFVYHCTPNRNVVIDTLAEFLKTREFKTIRHTKATKAGILKAYQDSNLFRYDLDEFNCIHYVNLLTGS